jgi:hypothetical protein
MNNSLIYFSVISQVLLIYNEHVIHFCILGCEAALSAKNQSIDKISKSSSGYLPDLTHGVNSSFYEFQCNDMPVQSEQYAEHFYEQPMVVFPPKHFCTDVLEKSPFLTNSTCGSGSFNFPYRNIDQTCYQSTSDNSTDDV